MGRSSLIARAVGPVSPETSAACGTALGRSPRLAIRKQSIRARSRSAEVPTPLPRYGAGEASELRTGNRPAYGALGGGRPVPPHLPERDLTGASTGSHPRVGFLVNLMAK